ncbi:MAG: selenocysteine-specific translation elongation factor [Burkholderiales bacterium RIFCSPHIGHO2_12_FULL_69_20]|nr:MAG: selenocysteine-specific translation elongation factor [Burkholderiales bacterium RIFCSPHIGHO2_12_FULL_69_20]
MIVATAGHVDHGKTTLVKALTGVDTDRLAEEQRRGMTIDLGFAYAPIDASTLEDEAGAEPMAFVDVPGHERFVRNMLAGVAAIDLALLVVAADDGAMPQTLEHLAILALLGVPQLVVALTKTDRVAPERVAQVTREIAALLAGGPFASAPVFTLAATAGTGVAALRQHLADTARALAARPVVGHFRLAIDRSFTLAGAGRIVTGTVLSGQVQVGDAVLLSPQGITLRVRGLHAQNRRADAARAGQRCALNLAGTELKRAEPERGDWVLAPAAHAPSDRLDVQLQVLASEARPLNQRAPLQLHLGAAAVNARVTALGAAALAPGDQGWAQLVLDRPVSAVFGDRFILRDAAANRTLAGGWVIDPAGPARGRARPVRLAQLAALALPDAEQALAVLLAGAADGVDLQPFAQARNLTAAEAEALHTRLSVQRVPCEAGPLGLSPAMAQAWRERVLAAVDRWHAEHPDRQGPDDAALRAALAIGSSATRARAVLRATLAGLVSDGLLVHQGLSHHRLGHRAELAEADRALLARVHAHLPPADLRPPIVGELATLLNLPLADLREFLIRMAQRGLLVRVAPNRFYWPETVDQLAAMAHTLAAESADGSYDAAGYRDRSGIGRNLTVQVIEFLDRAGLTRFDGARHRPTV